MNLELGLDLPAAEERAFTVTEVMEGVRGIVQQLPAIWVEGEISGLKVGSARQWYFTMKDKKSAMDCVMWSDVVRRLREKPEDGMKIYAKGSFTVFPGRGRLQFSVSDLLPTTEGGFHSIKLEQARRALEKDGLLDPARKRPLPEFPRCVGVVTSPEGAAWKDIVAVVARRWPHCELVLIGARVQGEDAPRELVRALGLANRFERLDVLIVGRGGGSKEDLWAFNDERVARALAASRVPTISAVGHEIDTTLTDLVADVRAATPSAAAEKAVPDRIDVDRRLAALRTHLSQAAGGRMEAAGSRLSLLRSRMAAAVTRRTQQVDYRLRAAAMRMATSCSARLARDTSRLATSAASLDALSPLKVLERGYAVARSEAGRVLRRLADFAPAMPFRLRVADGEVNARTEGKK
ncbi:MAG: exodeoxyribonuclease VII large subunit [Gemmatimonadales bacterium]